MHQRAGISLNTIFIECVNINHLWHWTCHPMEPRPIEWSKIQNYIMLSAQLINSNRKTENLLRHTKRFWLDLLIRNVHFRDWSRIYALSFLAEKAFLWISFSVLWNPLHAFVTLLGNLRVMFMAPGAILTIPAWILSPPSVAAWLALTGMMVNASDGFRLVSFGTQRAARSLAIQNNLSLRDRQATLRTPEHRRSLL
jgi:hypothetical protein